jgi:vitamin B12 transporter
MTTRILLPRPRPLRSRTTSRLFAFAGLLLCAAQPAPAANILEEIVVTSSRVPTPLREVGTSVSVLLEDTIEQRGFLNLTELLRTQPSVSASNTGGSGKATSLRIRGEEGYRTMVLIDGIDVADTSSPQVSPRLEHILSNGIERVEILRGPQGLSYGADAGGIINIRTVTPAQGFGGRLSAQTGSFGTQQTALRIGGASGTGDLALSATRLGTDGFNARSSDTTLRDDDGYDNRTLHARAGWNASEVLRVEAVLRNSDGDNEFDDCFNASFLRTNDCQDSFDQRSWRLAATYQGGAVEHQLAVSDSRTQREFSADGSSFFAADGALRRLSYLGNTVLGDAMSFVFGLDHEVESIDDGSFDRDREQLGTYGELQYRLTGASTVTAGLRYDDNEDFGNFTSYRLAAAHVLPLGGGELKLKASLGSGFRAPSLYEVSYNRGPFAAPPAEGTALREERSRGYDIGATWAFDDGAFFELTWFDQNVDDLIVFDLVAFSGYLQSGGESRSRGVELSGRLPMARSLTLEGNLTWSDAETPDGTPRPFRPRWLGNLSLNHQALDGRLRSGINLRSARSAVDTDGLGLDDYLLLDLNVSFALLDDLECFLRLENVLDENYQEVPGFLTAGQAAYAGVRYDF